MYRGKHRGPVTVRPTIPATVWVLLAVTAAIILLLLGVPTAAEWAVGIQDWSRDWSAATLLVTAPLIGALR